MRRELQQVHSNIRKHLLNQASVYPFSWSLVSCAISVSDLAYALDLCFGAKLKLAGVGPRSISDMRTQSAALSLQGRQQEYEDPMRQTW